MDMQRLYLPSTDSTNDELSRLRKNGELRGVASLRADNQENGKGQAGRDWVSEAGKNLIISFLLQPAFLSASGQFRLSKMAALAVSDLLKPLGLSALVKWPNDILVGGKKLAGILIEHSIHGKKLKHSIIGIGLNARQSEFPVFPRPASSILLECGHCPEPPALALDLEDCLLKRYGQLEKGEEKLVDSDYLERLYGRGQSMLFSSDGEEFKGIIRGVDEFGRLLLEREGKVSSFDMQELSFLD